jgi:hypothetical protein
VKYINLSDFDPSEEPYSLVDQDVFKLFNECLEAKKSGKVRVFSAEESIEKIRLVTEQAERFAAKASKPQAFTAGR